MNNEQAALLVRKGITPARVQEAISHDSAMRRLCETKQVLPDTVEELAARWPIQYNGGGHE